MFIAFNKIAIIKYFVLCLVNSTGQFIYYFVVLITKQFTLILKNTRDKKLKDSIVRNERRL